MSATRTSVRGPSGPLAAIRTVLKYLGLFIANGLALVIIYSLVRDDNLLLAVVIAIITIMVNVLNLVPSLFPFKWMSPGLALVTLLVIYPIIFTVLTALTNFSQGHLLTKQQAIDLIERRTYLPEGAETLNFVVFRQGEAEADDVQYAVWLLPEEAGGQMFFARPDEALEPVEADPASEDGIPAEYNGYQRLTERGDLGRAVDPLTGQTVGEGTEALIITSVSISPRRPNLAQQVEQRFVFNDEENAFFDNEENISYAADDEVGFFIPIGGTTDDALTPGYRVVIGLKNFTRLIDDPGLRGPLLSIFAWTVVFAAGSVVTTFAMGLFMALILNDPIVPFRKVIRSLLIIPYAIPGAISILTWRGMLNQNLGVITTNIERIFGVTIPWFADPFWSKVAILVVNLWLGYPYMMLICSGALQAIPQDIYEAADVDGASTWQRFWRITLPLLLVTVGPLLIASFTFNFNNYLLIEALTEGNPPMAGTITPAGHSDILISYTYNLAFGSDRGADYGYASAITIIIFAITAAVTLLNYRFTRTWEEVGENV